MPAVEVKSGTSVVLLAACSPAARPAYLSRLRVLSAYPWLHHETCLVWSLARAERNWGTGFRGALNPPEGKQSAAPTIPQALGYETIGPPHFFVLSRAKPRSVSVEPLLGGLTH
jgi:hypothetical protein